MEKEISEIYFLLTALVIAKGLNIDRLDVDLLWLQMKIYEYEESH
jgi:hypothetical protein